MLQNILNNKTQATFAEHLRTSLYRLSCDFTAIMGIIREHILSFSPYHPWLHLCFSGSQKILYGFYHKYFDSSSNISDLESGYLNNKMKKSKSWNGSEIYSEKADNKKISVNHFYGFRENFTVLQESEDNRRKKNFLAAIARLKISQRNILDDYKTTRIQFVWRQKVLVDAIKKRLSESNLSAFIDNEMYLSNSRKNSLTGIDIEFSLRKIFESEKIKRKNSQDDCQINSGKDFGFFDNEFGIEVVDDDVEIIYQLKKIESYDFNDNCNDNKNAIMSDDELKLSKEKEIEKRIEREKLRQKEIEIEQNLLIDEAAAIQEESLLLSWKNLSPRGAYLHRLSVLTDIFYSFETVLFAEEKNPFSIFSFIYRNFFTVMNYFMECFYIIWNSFQYFISVLKTKIYWSASGNKFQNQLSLDIFFNIF